MERVRVWDPLLRLCHWGLALTLLAAWLTRRGGGLWHEWLGYAALAILALRIAWGWLGPREARFAQFVPSPARTWSYLRLLARGRAPRFLGHNPLGAWMTVALLATVALVAGSGWLYTTDRFWGVAWMEAVHGTLTDLLTGLVALHVAGAAFTSWRQRENLVAAMLHGRKRTISE